MSPRDNPHAVDAPASVRRLAPTLAAMLLAAVAVAGSGCATRSGEVTATAANPAEFIAWDCARIDDETDLVQQRAADVAYTVDERAGNNIIALGVGLTVFWPAMLAMRPDGLEAAELARLKGRYEALRTAAADKACPPPAAELSAVRAAALPLALGERLVYEDRSATRGPTVQSVLRLTALRRGEIEFQLDAQGEVPTASAAAAAKQPNGGRPAKLSETRPSDTKPTAAKPANAATASAVGGTWRQDRSGNIVAAPPGALVWPSLLRGELALGAVTGGDIVVAGDPLMRARMRGQVVAVGAQAVAGRTFDVAVIELFGDAPVGEGFTRVDGALVVDRTSGVLLRLDLRSGNPGFALQRRLVRVDPPLPR